MMLKLVKNCMCGVKMEIWVSDVERAVSLLLTALVNSTFLLQDVLLFFPFCSDSNIILANNWCIIIR